MKAFAENWTGPNRKPIHLLTKQRLFTFTKEVIDLYRAESSRSRKMFVGFFIALSILTLVFLSLFAESRSYLLEISNLNNLKNFNNSYLLDQFLLFLNYFPDIFPFYAKFFLICFGSSLWAVAFLLTLSNSLLRDKSQTLRVGASIVLVLFFFYSSASALVSHIPGWSESNFFHVSDATIVWLESLRASAILFLLAAFFWKVYTRAKRLGYGNSQKSAWFVLITVSIFVYLFVFGPESKGLEKNSNLSEFVQTRNLVF
jgi:hypothetical protein